MPLTPASCGQRLWKEFLSCVRNSVDTNSYAAWFREFELQAIEERFVVARVPNPFVKTYIESRYLPVLREAARSCFGADVEVCIQVSPHEKNSPCPVPDNPRVENQSEDPPAPEPQRANMNVRLNNKYLFDNFVVGPCNQFSHAACLQVISSPAYSYNPLFIHGRSGLGKTHLLQATCRSIISRNPSVRVLYISCEDFINEFIASLKDGSLPSFRKRLRLLDCLFVDDIHFLARKKRMQEEFFHTFNALYDNQKQIVLSSDSKPHDMAHFEDRLLTRFQWGLMTSIDPPSLETRQVIAEQKANALDQRLPGCVSEYLARIVHRNVRELEGAVIKLIATARMLGRPIDLDLAKGALSDIAPPKVRTPGFSEIASAVANHYGISVSDLQSPRRLRALVVPRQISMYMIKSLTRSSLKEIGTYFGGRDHSTVLHALNQTEKLIKSDRGVKTCVRDLMAGFYASASV